MRRGCCWIVLAACALGSSFLVSTATPGTRAQVGCTLSGVRYVGSVTRGGRLCFTLTGSRKALWEWALVSCPATELEGSTRDTLKKPVTLRPDGRFSTTKTGLIDGWANITFEGRVQGSRAAGSITVRSWEGTHGGQCTWSARRAAS